MYKYQKIGFLTFILALLFSLNVNAQAKDYTFHTVFAYNFTKYIQWPTASPEMVIGVLGGDPAVVQAFEKMAQSKSTPDRRYVIKEVHRAIDASDCHLLFIPEAESGKLAVYAQQYANKPKILVTEKEGLIKKGGTINFITIDGKLRFELNQDAMDKAGLKVSHQLLSLAIVV